MKEELPKDLKYIGAVMSNFDYKIEDRAEKKLKVGDVYGTYPGRSFCASIWWDGRFKAMIKQYLVHTNTLESNTLQGIMDEACELYGDD